MARVGVWLGADVTDAITSAAAIALVTIGVWSGVIW